MLTRTYIVRRVPFISKTSHVFSHPMCISASTILQRFAPWAIFGNSWFMKARALLPYENEAYQIRCPNALLFCGRRQTQKSKYYSKATQLTYCVYDLYVSIIILDNLCDCFVMEMPLYESSKNSDNRYGIGRW